MDQGVGLGLAQEVAVEFPTWGEDFAMLIISVIVISQILGPPFHKWAIQRVGEAHERARPGEFDGVRDAIIFGVEGQSLDVARQLQNHGWQVKVACLTPSKLEGMAGADIDLEGIDGLTLEALHALDTEHADAIVAMLSDEENYRICELAYEHFGTDNLVVRLHDRTNFERFLELDALIVDPNTAIVSLLDHLVRSPSATSLILGLEEEQDVVEFRVRNPALHGVALRDLRLPLDTLVMSVTREGSNIISHGYTRLELGDRITVVGSPQSLDEVMLRFSAQGAPVKGAQTER